MNTDDPFDLLLEIERRSIEKSADLPASDKVVQEWVGVGFRIGNDRLIADMDEVKEILDLPDYTLVPGVQSWVVGVANVRGSLLPILDMKGFVMGEDIEQRRKGRVIVIDYKGFNTGLVVEEVFGLRHFSLKDRTEELPDVSESVTPYIDQAFKQESEHWPVFSFGQMAEDERFSKASL